MRCEYMRYLSLTSFSLKVALDTSFDNKRQLHLPAQLHRRLASHQLSAHAIHSTANPRSQLSEITTLT